MPIQEGHSPRILVTWLDEMRADEVDVRVLGRRHRGIGRSSSAVT
jgi:hypothetical protein